MKKRSKGWSLRRQLMASICVGLLLGMFAIRAINASLRPAVIAVVCDNLSNQITDEVFLLVNDLLEEEGISYDNICTIQRDESGKISALQMDMTRLNSLKSAIAVEVAEAYDYSVMTHPVYIPLGSVTSGVLFSGLGPSVRVEVLSVGNIDAEFENEFESTGINQTLHRITLTVTAELHLLIPGGVHSYVEETRMVLAETVLLGDVPGHYTYFDRFAVE